MNKYNLPAGVWDHPDEQDQQVYAEFVAVWNEEAFDDSPVFSAMSYYGGGDTYNETGSGGVVAGGCNQWFDKTTENNVTTLTIPVADDGYLDTQSSEFDFDSTSIRVGGDGTNQYQSWFHFCDVEIPADATITDAYLSFNSDRDDTSGNYTAVSISCEAADNATPPASKADGTGRTRTSASDNQFIWTYVYDSDGYGIRRTANLIDQLQEVVDRAGWNSNQSINLWMDYHNYTELQLDGYLLVDSVESGNGATLNVSYTTKPTTSLRYDCNADGYWTTSGNTFNTTASTIKVQDSNNNCFYHFTGVNVPAGSQVCSAILELTSSSRDFNYGLGKIQAIDDDNSTAIASKADGTSRALTTASRELIHGSSGRHHVRKEVNFHDVIQEVVERAGWTSGNSLQLLITGDGESQPASHHSVEATTASHRPQLRLIYFEPDLIAAGGVAAGGTSEVISTTTVDATGGVVVGGSPLLNSTTTVDATGGAVAGGAAHRFAAFNPDFQGGAVSGGTTDLQVIVNVEGGAVVAGESTTQYTAAITTHGGAVLNGLATVQVGILATGGVVTGGISSLNTSTTVVTSGGVVAAGESAAYTSVDETASGGLVVSQPRFANGFTHRTSVTVPAGSVASDMVFYLGVRLDVVSDEFLITDLAGNVQSHEVREITETATCLFWRCQLESEQDNVFLVYFNLEES